MQVFGLPSSTGPLRFPKKSVTSGIAQKTIFACHTVKKLSGSEWGAGAKTPLTIALLLNYSTADYCVPVWCCSAHTGLINNVLYDVLYIVTRCLCPTPTDRPPILSGIQPVELLRLRATLFLATGKSLDPDRKLNSSIGPKISKNV